MRLFVCQKITSIDFSPSRTNRKPRIAKTLRYFYATRLELQLSPACARVLTNKSLPDLSFSQFALLFSVQQKTLVPRPKKPFRVIRFWPSYKPHANGPKYHLHCKTQLIKHKPWTNEPNSMLLHADDDEDADENELWIQTYRHFLNSSQAEQYIPELENEMKNAMYAHEFWQRKNAEVYEDIPHPELHLQDEWMQIANFHQIYKSDAPERDDWDKPRLHWTPHEIRQMPTWVSDLEKNYVPPARKHVDLKIALRNASPDQRAGYDVVERHFQSDTSKPLRLIVHGRAGTGKSYLLNLLAARLTDAAHFAATTGTAACIINGETIHRLLGLPTKAYHEKPLSLDRLKKLQDKWGDLSKPQKTYIFIDEMSMLGQKTLYWIDQRCKQLTGRKTEYFGGLSIILCGDFGQLPPVKDTVMFGKHQAEFLSQKHINAEKLFSFDQAIILDTQHRVARF